MPKNEKTRVNIYMDIELRNVFKTIAYLKGDTMSNVLDGYVKQYVNENKAIIAQ